jgi:hypothetical protein
MHVRKAGKFEPLEECPPHGCLRCADAHDEGEPPCGSELLGQAAAWTMADFKKNPWDKNAVPKASIIPLQKL